MRKTNKSRKPETWGDVLARIVEMVFRGLSAG